VNLPDSSFCALLEDLDGGQLLSLEEFEKRPARGRHVADLAGDTELASAATVSPPPARENAEDRAMACAMVRVPAANCSYSNTPSGPFQTMVAAWLSAAARMAALLGPMSRMRSSAATSATALVVALAVADNSLATTTSTGSGTLPPLALICAMTRLASSTRSGSHNDLPIGMPEASMKVLLMPPPTIS
jgi:hypothetical protein